MIETKIEGEPKNIDKKDKEYTDIESFQIRTTLQKIEIKESQRKRNEKKKE